MPPSALVEPSSLHLFKLIWFRDGGAFADTAGVVRAAITDTEILKAKYDKEKKESAGKGAKKSTGKKAKK